MTKRKPAMQPKPPGPGPLHDVPIAAKLRHAGKTLKWCRYLTAIHAAEAEARHGNIRE